MLQRILVSVSTIGTLTMGLLAYVSAYNDMGYLPLIYAFLSGGMAMFTVYAIKEG